MVWKKINLNTYENTFSKDVAGIINGSEAKVIKAKFVTYWMNESRGYTAKEEMFGFDNLKDAKRSLKNFMNNNVRGM